MDALILIWFFIFGTIIGSFLNVVIYRLNTGKSLGGHSHCLSCGTQLGWYELIPLMSYLMLVGRCRTCSARITPRYFSVELLTGVLFACTTSVYFFDLVLLGLMLGVTAVLIVILVYDIRHTIIPDQLVLYLLVVAVAYMLWDPLAGSVALPQFTTFLGGVIPSAFFGGLWLFSRGRWIGLGDAKLVLPLGFMTGLAGALSMMIFAFWVGAVVSVGLLLIQRIVRRFGGGKLRLPFSTTRLTIKSEVPFAPFLITAFFLVQLTGADAFALIDRVVAHFIF